jgi:hypothetical protein
MQIQQNSWLFYLAIINCFTCFSGRFTWHKIFTFQAVCERNVLLLLRCYCRIHQQEQAIEVSSVGNIVQYQEGNVNMAFIED